MEIAHSERRENRLQQLFSRFVSVVACFMFPFCTRNKPSASTIWVGNPALYIKPREAQSVISCYLKACLLTLKVNHLLSRAPQPQLEQARCRNQQGALRETPHAPMATYQQWQRMGSAGRPEHANTPVACLLILARKTGPWHRCLLTLALGDKKWAMGKEIIGEASPSQHCVLEGTSLPTALLLLRLSFPNNIYFTVNASKKKNIKTLLLNEVPWKDNFKCLKPNIFILIYKQVEILTLVRLQTERTALQN